MPPPCSQIAECTMEEDDRRATPHLDVPEGVGSDSDFREVERWKIQPGLRHGRRSVLSREEMSHSGHPAEAGRKREGADPEDETIFAAHDHHLTRATLAVIWRRIVARGLRRELVRVAL